MSEEYKPCGIDHPESLCEKHRHRKIYCNVGLAESNLEFARKVLEIDVDEISLVLWERFRNDAFKVQDTIADMKQNFRNMSSDTLKFLRLRAERLAKEGMQDDLISSA